MKKTLIIATLISALGACTMQGDADTRIATGEPDAPSVPGTEPGTYTGTEPGVIQPPLQPAEFRTEAERAAYIAGQYFAATQFTEELIQRDLVTKCESDFGVTYVFKPEPC